MPLSNKQQGVLRGMIAAVVLSAAGLTTGAILYPEHWLPDDAGNARFSFAARSILFLGFWLMISIASLARHRFLTPEDIDGSGLTTGTNTAKMLQAVLQNTLEQTVLAGLTYGAFAALAPVSLLGALPAATLLFLCGRALFWYGYANGAASRALGFALTFYSTALLLLATTVLLILT
jgi:MAPEG family